ncbi:hypothetical protein HanIR_Chr03g0119561 [Helianthus annuus]|nr:hypothetical protein HanIR_Chr03g0119561 [Helianthus annuus]
MSQRACVVQRFWSIFSHLIGMSQCVYVPPLASSPQQADPTSTYLFFSTLFCELTRHNVHV